MGLMYRLKKLLDAPGGATGPGYQVYVAKLTQSNAGAPVATVIENTIGEDITWTRAAAGIYQGSLPALTASQTVAFISGVHGSTGIAGISANQNGHVDITTVTFDGDAFASDDSILSGAMVEIRIYPGS